MGIISKLKEWFPDDRPLPGGHNHYPPKNSRRPDPPPAPPRPPRDAEMLRLYAKIEQLEREKEKLQSDTRIMENEGGK